MKTNYFQYLILISGILLSVHQACSPKTQAAENAPNLGPEQQELAEKGPETTDQPETEIVSSGFPKDVLLLIPASYREEYEGAYGYPKNLDKKEWMELYKDETGEWKIEPARIRFSKGFDECIGINTLVVPANHETTVCYFTPFQSLSKKLKTLAEYKLLKPGKNISLPFGQTEFWLNISGTMNDEVVSDLKLDFASDISSVRLLDQNDLNDVQPELIWAGDLNEDSFPDLIISAPTDYEEKRIYFFLSDPTDPKNQLKIVAETHVVFDC